MCRQVKLLKCLISHVGASSKCGQNVCPSSSGQVVASDQVSLSPVTTISRHKSRPSVDREWIDSFSLVFSRTGPEVVENSGPRRDCQQCGRCVCWEWCPRSWRVPPPEWPPPTQSVTVAAECIWWVGVGQCREGQQHHQQLFRPHPVHGVDQVELETRHLLINSIESN